MRGGNADGASGRPSPRPSPHSEVQANGGEGDHERCPMKSHSGGCQCGAIRFRVEGKLDDASVCHCRMCQKAFGGFYAPLVSLRHAKLTWTRGSPKMFQSSNFVSRGFCANLRHAANIRGAGRHCRRDRRLRCARNDRFRVYSGASRRKLPYVDHIHELPAKRTLDDATATHFLANLVSYQHPDHDTDNWPPA